MQAKTLSQIEQEQSDLVRFALFLITICVGIATAVEVLHAKVPETVTPALTVTALIGCLYVIVRERRLRRAHRDMVIQLLATETEVERLSGDVKTNQDALEGEKVRAQSLESRLKELTCLYRAISAVNAISDPQTATDSVLRAALDLVGADTGSIMLVEEGNKHMVIVAAQGLSGDVVMRTRQRIGDGIAGWVAAEGAPLLLNGDLAGDERFQNLVERAGSVHLSMCVPLQLCGRVTGVINFGVTRAIAKKAFDECDLRLATIFAQHAAVALEYSRAIAPENELAVVH